MNIYILFRPNLEPIEDDRKALNASDGDVSPSWTAWCILSFEIKIIFSLELLISEVLVKGHELEKQNLFQRLERIIWSLCVSNKWK